MGTLSCIISMYRARSCSGESKEDTSIPCDFTTRVAVESINSTGTDALLMTVSEMNDSINSSIASRSLRSLTLSA